MATEIDIEEHDVLQDSKVMGIFPDLSLVKTEVLDVEEQDEPVVSNPEAVPDSTTGYDSPQPFQRAAESPHAVTSTQEDGTTSLRPKIIGIQSSSSFFNNRIVLGQKPATPANVDDDQSINIPVEDKTTETSHSGEISDLALTLEVDADKLDCISYLQHNDLELEGASSLETVNNCIVLGQKPSSGPHALTESDFDLDNEELMKCYSATVILDDWGPYLNRSDSYCKECEILFATVNALDAHKMTAHSFLVAVDTKEPVAGNSKPFDPKKSCFVCQKTFTNHSDLIQHIYHHVATTQTCAECKQTFLSKKLLLEHMKVHVKSEPEVPDAPKPANIAKDALYKCCVCRQTYASLGAVTKHLRKKHARTSVTTKDYTMIENMKCSVCSYICPGKATYSAHMLKHKLKCEMNITTTPNSPSTLQDDVFVPKSTLFWCSECDVHFTSLSVAFAHKKTCPETISRHCQQCPLTLASTCTERHEVQHTYADNGDFDVLDVDMENLAAKLLCVCPRCESNCSVHTLWKHLYSCPVDLNYHCPICEVYVDKATENEHRFTHDAHRFTKSDFITIEYVIRDEVPEQSKDGFQNVIKVGKKRKLDDSAESHSSKRSKTENAVVRDNEFVYCEHCKLFMPKTERFIKKHLLGSCAKKERRCVVCYSCGLSFAALPIKHRDLHKDKHFTFQNFNFFDLRGRPIPAPLPEYLKCAKCRCYFTQTKALKEHTCPAIDTIRCIHCDGTFSQMAHVVHMKCHTLLLKKDSSTRVYVNKKTVVKMGSELAVGKQLKPVPSKKTPLYYCLGCKLYFMGSGHVERPECGTASSSYRYRRRTCETCGVVVVFNNYKHHLGLHAKQGVTLQNFRFFNMKKIEFLTPPIPKYYPCQSCKVHFHTEKELKTHQCEGITSRPCKVCKDKFTPQALRLHEPFHQKIKQSVNGIVVYQCSKCTYVFSKSQAQHRHLCAGPKNPSSHKYCDLCHLTMYTEVYEQHLRSHDNFKIVLFDPIIAPPAPSMVTLHCDSCEIGYDFEIEKRKKPQGCPACGLRLSLRTPDYLPVTKPKLTLKKYNYYQCRYCNVTLKKREQMILHLKACGDKRKFDTPMTYCKICDLHFTKQHPISHLRYLNLCKRTIQLMVCGKTQRQPLVVCSQVTGGNWRNDARTPKIDVKARQFKAMARKIDIKTRKVVLPSKVTDKAGAKRKYTLHQCRNCGAHVSKAHRFMSHDCANMNIVHLTYCPICKLNVMLSSYKYHMRYHAGHPDMVPENIRVLHYGENRGARSVVVDSEFAENSSKFDTAKQRQKADDGRESASVDLEEEEFERTPDAIEARDSEPKYTLYRCNRCHGCVSSEKKAEMHQKQQNCADLKIDHCKLCGLDMVVRFLRFHLDRHSYDPNFTRDNMRVVPFGEVAKDSELSPRVKFTLYQCAECLVCSDEQYEHLCDDVAKRTCEICQYDIEASYFARHTECHNNDNYQRSAIRILPLDFPDGNVSERDAPLQQKKRRFDGSLVAKRLDGALVTKKTVDVYKCTCGLHFLCRKSLEKHSLACRGVGKETTGLSCSKCRLVFDASQLLQHSISHHGNLNFDIKYNVIECHLVAGKTQAQVTRERQRSKLSKKPYHFKVKFRKTRPKKQCRRCGKNVDSCNFSRHLKKHIKVDKLAKKKGGKKDVMPSTNIPDKKSMESRIAKANLCKKLMFECGLCDVYFMDEDVYNAHRLKNKHVASPKIQCTYCELFIYQQDIVRHCGQFHRRTHKTISSRYTKALYYCTVCTIHFLTLSDLKRHVRNSTHKKFNPYPCPHCGLTFTFPGRAHHIYKHHRTHTFKRGDFIIRDQYNRIRSARNKVDSDDNENGEEVESGDEETNVSFDEIVSNGNKNGEDDDAQADDDSESERNVDATETREASSPKYTLYRCNKCQGCVSCKAKAMIHKRHRNCEEMRKDHCKICGLDMVVRFLRYHIDKHSAEPEFTRDNMRIVPFGEVAKVTETASTNESEDGEDDVATVSVDETSGNNNKDDEASVESDVDVDTESVAEITEINVSKDTKKVTDDASNEVNERKRLYRGYTYYKCTACNVYFLQYNNIQKHLRCHTPMSEFDFIECNFCKMNFKLNSLRSHMEHHKNNTFALDKVLFMEYSPKSYAAGQSVSQAKKETNLSAQEENPRLEKEKEESNSSDPRELSHGLGKEEPSSNHSEERNPGLEEEETVPKKQNPKKEHEELVFTIPGEQNQDVENGNTSSTVPDEQNPRLENEEKSSTSPQELDSRLDKGEYNSTSPEIPRLENGETSATVLEKRYPRMYNVEKILNVPEDRNHRLETAEIHPAGPYERNQRLEKEEEKSIVPEEQNPTLERDDTSSTVPEKQNPRLEKGESSQSVPEEQNPSLESGEIHLDVPQEQNQRLGQGESLDCF